MQRTAPPKKVGRLEIFFRLTRAQFIPLIILPSAVGTTYAFNSTNSFNLGYFALVILGVVLLHLGANAIDDCYDYQNGVDRIANSIFPKDFGGWKPLPRSLLSLRDAKIISYLLFLGSLLISVYFSFVVGYWSLIFAISGILLAISYTAPPVKLDYRGKGLGEIAILLAFGPIPVLGSFYVQTGSLNLSAFLISLAVGIMTVTILIDHDLIFYEVYVKVSKIKFGSNPGKIEGPFDLFVPNAGRLWINYRTSCAQDIARHKRGSTDRIRSSSLKKVWNFQKTCGTSSILRAVHGERITFRLDFLAGSGSFACDPYSLRFS